MNEYEKDKDAQKKINNTLLKQLIKEYVFDHYKTFGFYPNDVEVEGSIYTFPDYFNIINS